MTKLIGLLFITLCVSTASAATVIFGKEAEEKFVVMLEQNKMDPTLVAKSESLFFGSDTHPNSGKLRLTDLNTLDGSNVRCWKEDYFEVGEVYFGCSF